MSHGVVCKYHYRGKLSLWLTSVTVWLILREGVAKSPCRCGSIAEIYMRKIWAEGSFSVLKREHCLSKVRKRGIPAVTEECLLSAMALNLKRMVKAILLSLHKLKIWTEIIHFQPRFLFCQQVPYCTLSRSNAAKLMCSREKRVSLERLHFFYGLCYTWCKSHYHFALSSFLPHHPGENPYDNLIGYTAYR